MRFVALLLLIPITFKAADAFEHETAVEQYVQQYLDGQGLPGSIHRCRSRRQDVDWPLRHVIGQ